MNMKRKLGVSENMYKQIHNVDHITDGRYSDGPQLRIPATSADVCEQLIQISIDCITVN